jgi:peptidoglycan hydrolase-like protein with peptidoglycan-binding domain
MARSSADSSSTVLRRGSTGAAVSALQRQLKGLGFYSGPVDGDFGPATDRAIRAFQEARKLKADGQAGAATLAELERPEPPPPPAGTLRLGAHGEPVTRLQRALAERGYYRGPLDGDFGGGTQAALRAFQAAEGLGADGVAGSRTWQALLREPVPEPPIRSAPLAQRCLTLTGSFETGKGPPDCFADVVGDFDGQGISFGVLQWNFGQGSLQRLLRDVEAHDGAALPAAFGEHWDELRELLEGDENGDRESLMAWTRSIQDRRFRLHEPWGGMFRALGRSDAGQAAEVRQADARFERAGVMRQRYGLWSERAQALMFEITVQNGSIPPPVQAQILSDFDALPPALPAEELEVSRMRIVANRRAEAANARWVEDVRARKLCCANGAGRVHGQDYDLADQYGIRLQRIPGS